jgi:hypothetical protein
MKLATSDANPDNVHLHPGDQSILFIIMLPFALLLVDWGQLS